MAARGVSLRDLESMSGVGRDTLIDLKHGRRKPHPETVRKVAAALRLSTEMLRKGPPRNRKAMA